MQGDESSGGSSGGADAETIKEAGPVALSPSAFSRPGGRKTPKPEELAPYFPDLEIQRLVGVGGMGMVYQARQKRLSRDVALKVLRVESVNPEFIERFQREAVTLAKLTHPNIVSIHDQGERDGWFFLLMEYVDGTDLSHAMKQRKLEPSQSVEIIDAVTAALEYAHERKIVHRDIKPANILMDRSGGVKIADFGLAKLREAEAHDFTLTTEDSSMGTPFYMAPEQRKSSADADHRADIYSVGVLFYELLTEELPQGRVRAPSEISDTDPALDSVVLKALEPDPERRFQSAGEMRESLLNAMNPEVSVLTMRSLLFGAVALLVVSGVLIGMLGNGNPLADQAEEAFDNPAAVLPELTTDDACRLSAANPVRNGLFGSVISAGGNFLAVSYAKANIFLPFLRAKQAGEVYLYKVDENGVPGEPTILTAESSKAGDHFGYNVVLDPNGEVLAVASPFKIPPASTDNLGVGEKMGAIDLYRRRDENGKNWELEETIYLDSDFKSLQLMHRINLEKGLLTVGGPKYEGRGAVKVYEHRESGSWELTATLEPEEGLLDADFGMWTCYHEATGTLFVCSGFIKETPSHLVDRVRIYRRDLRSGSWSREGELLDPQRNAFSHFGVEARIVGDTLAVAAPTDTVGAVLAAGSVSIFKKDPESPQGWTHQQNLVVPSLKQTRAGFGGRVDMRGNHFAALSAQVAEESGKNYGVAYLFEEQDNGTWKAVSKISGEKHLKLWVGRLAFGNHFFALGSPTEDEPGSDNPEKSQLDKAGAVFVFPLEKLGLKPSNAE